MGLQIISDYWVELKYQRWTQDKLKQHSETRLDISNVRKLGNVHRPTQNPKPKCFEIPSIERAGNLIILFLSDSEY